MAKLDVSRASLKQKEEILKYAADVRKFEIGLFWQRSLFFWGFIGAAFVAYGVLIDKNDKDFALAVSCFGLICSFAWTLQNRGSKYWQEAWEQKVNVVEDCVLKARLFSNIEPVEDKGWFGAARFSVSKLAIALSDFTVLIWLVLAWKVLPAQLPILSPLPSSPGALLVPITAVYIVVLFVWGRSN
jgi:hypothetical protein